MNIAEPRLARRMSEVVESATLRLNAAVQAMKAKGVDVVNLTAGEPDFYPPEAAKQAVIDAVKANKSRYTPAPGIPELRQAVADKTNRDQPAATSVPGAKPWTGNDVVVTNGGKQAIYNAFMALIDPGESVLVPSPYWVSYPDMAKLAGGVPRILPTDYDKGFKLQPATLRAALKTASRPRILVLNSPSNPCGVMYSREELAALGAELDPKGDVWVVSDEIYDRIVYDGKPFASFLEACPAMRPRTVTVNGMSKVAAMTGWRIGWTVAPPVVTKAVTTLQGQTTSNVCALSQWASLAALKLPASDFEPHRAAYQARRDLCLEILGKAGKLKLFVPAGAFYAFVGVGAALKPGEDSIGFCERLLEGARVAAVPGTSFGEPEWMRLSFSVDDATLREGCERIVQFLKGS